MCTWLAEGKQVIVLTRAMFFSYSVIIKQRENPSQRSVSKKVFIVNALLQHCLQKHI